VANNNQIYKMSNAGGFKSLTRYYDMLAGNAVWNPWSPTGAFDALATVSLSTGTSYVEFTGIPTGYKHLQVRGILMNATGNDNVAIRLNGDTGSNYSSHQLQGNGSSASANSSPAQPTMYLSGLVIASSSYPFAFTYDILDYASTNKAKVIRGLSGQDGNGTGTASDWRVQLTSGAWYNTAAVTSLRFYLPSYNMGNYTQFALYGVK